MPPLIKQVRQSLKESAAEKTKAGSQRFFKEKIKFYGVKVSALESSGFKIVERLDTTKFRMGAFVCVKSN